MAKSPQELYLELMQVVRSRFDTIEALVNNSIDNYGVSEIVAFHGRKIIEAIAFGCLVGLENGLKVIPRDAQGQYNAETIFKVLAKKRLEIFPSPSVIRVASEQEKEQHNVTAVVEGIPERRISREEMAKKYQRMHRWLHELNPYTKEGQEIFYQNNKEQLWGDINEISLFMNSHVLSINGEAFFCVLRDKTDGLTKVSPLFKVSNS